MVFEISKNNYCLSNQDAKYIFNLKYEQTEEYFLSLPFEEFMELVNPHLDQDLIEGLKKIFIDKDIKDFNPIIRDQFKEKYSMYLKEIEVGKNMGQELKPNFNIFLTPYYIKEKTQNFNEI